MTQDPSAWRPVDPARPAERWRWVIEIAGCPPGPRQVLSVLAYMADRDGRAWPSLDTLARRVGVTPRAIRSHVRLLTAAGVIEIQRRRRQSSCYVLRFDLDPRAIVIGADTSRPEESSGQGWASRPEESSGQDAVRPEESSAQDSPARPEESSAQDSPARPEESSAQGAFLTGRKRHQDRKILPFRGEISSAQQGQREQGSGTGGESARGRAPTRARRASRIDPEWRPSPDDLEWATANAFTASGIEAEIATFVDHYVATGKTMVKWGRAWRNWMRKARDFRPEVHGPDRFEAERRESTEARTAEDAASVEALKWLVRWREHAQAWRDTLDRLTEAAVNESEAREVRAEAERELEDWDRAKRENDALNARRQATQALGVDVSVRADRLDAIRQGFEALTGKARARVDAIGRRAKVGVGFGGR